MCLETQTGELSSVFHALFCLCVHVLRCIMKCKYEITNSYYYCLVHSNFMLLNGCMLHKRYGLTLFMVSNCIFDALDVLGFSF